MGCLRCRVRTPRAARDQTEPSRSVHTEDLERIRPTPGIRKWIHRVRDTVSHPQHAGEELSNRLRLRPLHEGIAAHESPF